MHDNGCTHVPPISCSFPIFHIQCDPRSRGTMVASLRSQSAGLKDIVKASLALLKFGPSEWKVVCMGVEEWHLIRKV